MSSKHQAFAADSTGLSFLSRFPLRLSLRTSLLASVIPLPDNPQISYAVWSPAASTKSSEWPNLVEQARRRIIQQNAGLSIVESMLPSLHISGDSIALYVFAISSVDGTLASRSQLARQTLAGLTRSEMNSFSPASVYPCSEVCATQHTPCTVCIAQTNSAPAGNSARQLPRRSLRRPFIQFLDSIRERLILSITESPRNMTTTATGMPAVRLKSGFLFGSISSQSEWRSGWERYSHDQPYTYCELTIQLSQLTETSARLIVQPWLRLSQYHPLLPSLPVSAGTPLVLLPYGVPAYFLSLYTGPASTLTARFSDALADLGAGDWKEDRLRQPSKTTMDPVYIIVWVQVPNKSGEEKGVVLVWPASLSASFLAGSSSKHAQSRLDNLPSLPAHLQASPPPTESHVPLVLLSAKDPPSEQDIHLSLSQRPSPVSTSSHPPSPDNTTGRFTESPPTRLGLGSAPSCHTLHAFRSLTLQHVPQDLNTVASEVSGFVGAVVREREKERERKKRERQSSGSLPALGPEAVALPPASSPPAADTMEFIPTSPDPILAAQDSPLYTVKSRSGSLFSDDGSNPDMSLQDESMEQISASSEVKLEPILDAPSHSTSPMASTSVPSNLDSFPGFESGWSQSSGDYLPTNGDYSMDFLGAGLSTADDLRMDGSFDVFTEDDFDFFSGPTLVGDNAITEMLPPDDKYLVTVFTPSTPSVSTNGVVARTPLDDGMPLGMGPPSAQSYPSPWTLFHGPDGFTPQTEPVPNDQDAVVKFKGTLDQRPPSAALMLDQHISSSNNVPIYHKAFDPIPFNVTHRESDGKYVLGKFALPSPPTEDDDDVPAAKPSGRTSTKIPLSATWKSSYSTATDPRVGMTKRLAGFKRRLAQQGGRVPNVSPARFRASGEWIETDAPLVDDTSESENEEFWIADDPMSPDPKPATPPPSYLPLGPTLLQTYFHYPFLQQYTVALNTPGSAPHNTITSPAAISAPTPISPAAILGSSSEKARSLEAASQILLREAVENPVWSEAWRASVAARRSRQHTRNVRPVDLKRVAHFLDGVESLTCPVELDVLLKPDSEAAGDILRCMSSPLFTVGKAGEVINILPSALRFWENLGLSPRSGAKDAEVFIIFDQTTVRGEREIVSLLDRLSSVYTAKHYGKHIPGLAPGSQDGIVPIRFETFRKSLSSFVSGLPPISSNIVIYILTPDYILHMTSPVLRQVLSAIKRINKTRQPSSPILFQFVPERLLASTSAPTNSDYSSVEAFIDSVYDRIRVPVARHASCRYPSSADENCSLQQSPAITLARPLQPTVVFAKQESVDVLDVIDRYTLLQVGYQVSHQGKWLLASCTDQHGEISDLKAWLLPSDDTVDTFIVGNVWAFAMATLVKANLEWVVALTKRGPIGAHEASAWSAHLNAFLRSDSTVPIHVLLLSVDQNNPWYMFADPHDTEPSPSSARGPRNTGNLALDLSSTTFTLHANDSTPIPQRTREGVTVDQLTLTTSDEAPSIDELGVLPITTSTLVHVPSEMDYASISMLHLYFMYLWQSSRSTTKFGIEDMQQRITKNFYELKVLAQARWGPLGSHNLPLHIAALEVMFTTLDEPDGNGFIN